MAKSDTQFPEFYVSNIRFLRKKYELHQEEIIELLGLKTTSAYSKKESGSVPFSIKELIKLSDFFGVSIDQLVKQDMTKEAD